MGMGGGGGMGGMDKFSGYGVGFFRQQPSLNMHGNTFFTAFQNQGRNNQEATYDQAPSLDRVNGFLELRFKKSVRRTRCFEGPFPEWNETLCFNYSMKHEQTSLEKILLGAERPIKLFAFDMLEQGKPTQAIAEARVKKTKFYLGRIDIPFSFIAAVPSISGLFRLDRPLIALGFGVRRTGLFDFEGEADEAARTENPDIHTYINLDLFSEPLIDGLVAYNSDRKFVAGSGENPLVLQRASDWLDELNSKRYVRLWLNNLEGKSVFICRYLSDAVSPPKLQDGSGSLIERCARFVSLIPRRHNCRLLEGTEEFHMSCHEFLNVKMGEDHAILLCNYFNFVDRAEGRRDVESMLLVCKAFPYGKCLFVLRRDRTTRHCEVWDPFRGECYYFPAKEYDTFCCFIRYEKQAEGERSRDACPIIELSCIVGRDNVYFNLQESVRLPGVDLNVDDDRLWRPFLTERSRNELFEKGAIETVQTPISAEFYPETQKLQSGLENELQQYIRDHLEAERRSHFRPYTFKLNARLSNIANNRLLPLCETFRLDHRTSAADSPLYSERARAHFDEAVAKIQEERDKLKNEVPTEKNLFGFTLNATFTTLPEVLEKIADTQIHLDENEDIEFVLAVRCFEYTCHLVSVWVFIGTLS